jgi:predicted O-linked N-acetylglucosamine transferase (SPINDLY family)
MLREYPANFDALFAAALICAQQGRFEDSETHLQKALALRPQSAEAHYNRGSVLQKLGRSDEALICFDTALSLRPDYAEALGNRGALMMAAGRYQDALADFTHMTAAKPQLAEGWSNQGSLLIRLNRKRDALTSYSRALNLKPDMLEARRARAWLCASLGQFAEALVDLAFVLARNPDDARTWQQRGDILAQAGRREMAIESYGRAIALKPDSVDAFFNRAQNLFSSQRYEESAADYAAVVKLDPHYRYALGHLIFAKLCTCDWERLDELVAEMQTGLRGATIAAQPFHALVLAGSEQDILRATLDFAGAEYPAKTAGKALHAHEKIRIGYLSANFHNHAVSRLATGVFEHHDRSRFEFTAFSLGADDGGPLRRRLMAAFDVFIDVKAWDDDRIAQEIRRREIDILVDLMGYTENSRPGIAAQRPAPLQMNYLGFAGTMGSAAADYLIGDSVVIPQASEGSYSEKIIRLPGCYLPADCMRRIADAPVSRAAAGLPDAGFVFCCFNHSYKITSEIFGIWMRLLCRCPGSVLWLNQINPAAKRNLLAHAQSHEIDPGRIVFADFAPDDADHLARLGMADLFLDTPQYNAHATAMDALWAGVPVLTVAGKTFPARVGASLLNSIGLPELIARDLPAYEEMANALASDPERLRQLRKRLAANRMTQPLFDTVAFTRNLESAFAIALERLRRGLPPESFRIGERDGI